MRAPLLRNGGAYFNTKENALPLDLFIFILKKWRMWRMWKVFFDPPGPKREGRRGEGAGVGGHALIEPSTPSISSISIPTLKTTHRPPCKSVLYQVSFWAQCRHKNGYRAFQCPVRPPPCPKKNKRTRDAAQSRVTDRASGSPDYKKNFVFFWGGGAKQ